MTKIIILKEGLWQSIVSDTYTYSLLAAGFTLNYLFIQSWVVDIVVVLSAAVGVVSTIKSDMKRTFHDIDEAIAYLESLKGDDLDRFKKIVADRVMDDPDFWPNRPDQ